ncbi:MAG: hypothetical protein AABO58_08300 [Acidobacteriota bacterium]
MSIPAESTSIRPRVLLKVLIASAIYIAAVRFLTWFVENHPDSRWRVVAAAAPVAASGIFAAAAMLSARGMDERDLRVHLEALAFGFLASLVFVTTYSFLWLADVVPMQFELLSIPMVIFWVVGLGVALWRYR